MTTQELVDQAFAEQQRLDFYRTLESHTVPITPPPPPVEEVVPEVVEVAHPGRYRAHCPLCSRSFVAPLAHVANASLARHHKAHLRRGDG